MGCVHTQIPPPTRCEVMATNLVSCQSGVALELHHIHMSLVVSILRSVHPTGREMVATNLVLYTSGVALEVHHIHMSLGEVHTQIRPPNRTGGDG